MNLALFRHTLRQNSVRAVLLAAGAFSWGWLIVTVFTTFSPLVRQLTRTNPFIEQFAQFGSGNFFTLPGSLTLGFQHPLLIALIAVIAVGSSSMVIAGERQAGTLELLLARPLARRTVYLSCLAALLLLVGVLVAVTLAGMSAGVAFHGLQEELAWRRMPAVLVNGFLLWAAFTTFSLAASVTFDRPGPAVGLSLAYLLLNYFLEVVGSLWDAAQWMQQYSLLHRFDVARVLSAGPQTVDLIILTVATLLPLAYALLVFPGRDIPAPD